MNESTQTTIKSNQIQNLIYTIRGEQVMLDRDLANMYDVLTRNLNKAVKRNIDRFPKDFMFQLTKKEFEILKFQNGTSSWGGRRKLPFVFTEQGVTTLSGVLKSKKAIEINIQIVRTFVSMRRFLSNNAQLFQRMGKVELKQLEQDSKINQVFNALEKKQITPTQGIIYNGQIFDAHSFISKIIKSAKKSIVIIDNYIDESVLTQLTKRSKNVAVKIYTKNISKQLKLDIEKFNKQYGNITVKIFNTIHDRFIIIDDCEIYRSGASLKDLGKKISTFSKFDKAGIKLLNKLK